jgi:acetylornithine deacetylase
VKETFSPAEMLGRLVAFDTTSRGSNLALIHWVRDYLAAHGVASHLTYNDDRNKANLFATIGGEAARGGGIVLSGHTDVVPVDGQAWDTDPFAMTERGGNLYGRGTADMKGFIAIALALVPELTARKLRTPIHLALSYDEEVGCFGVPRLVEAMPAGAGRPRLAIVGEPTELRIVTANKGAAVFATTVTGLEAHSSATHRSVNAIFAAGEIIGCIARLAAEHAANPQPDSRFDPPYTTFNVGTIAGGTAQNIIPRHCRFTWEYRLLPGDDGEAIERRVQDFISTDLLPRLRRVHPGSDVVTERLAEVPYFQAAPDSPIEALLRQITGSNAPAAAVAFVTEAGFFESAGLPTVVCGPGSIDVAHKPNEYISREQLDAGTDLIRRIGAWAATAG